MLGRFWLARFSAIQSDNQTVGIECIQGIVQTGRKARAAN